MNAEIAYGGYTVYFEGSCYVAEPTDEDEDYFLQMSSRRLEHVLAAIDAIHACDYRLPAWLADAWGTDRDAYVDLDVHFPLKQPTADLVVLPGHRRR